MRVRIAAIQYQLRRIGSFDEFEQQVNVLLEAAAEYQPHYVLLPELFTSQLMSVQREPDPQRSVQRLSEYTQRYVELMTEHATRHEFYLIAGSHPTEREGQMFNTSYLFTPSGRYYTQDKIHRTRWEKDPWGLEAGHIVKLFDTEYAKIGILICYDVEFPELARMLSEAGAEILFVPSCTDDRQGYLRVKYCCHARAIENQIYVVMTSTVGSLPVANMQLHYGCASVITPSDFPFSRDGIAAEGMINQEQIVIADLNLALLDENRLKGTTIPLLDKRKDVYERVAVIEEART